MGAVTLAVLGVVGLILGWISIEIACKPCLKRGREAIDRNLNPDYDPDDDDTNTINAPLNPNPSYTAVDSDPVSASIAIKAV
ncbi:hypothetical protein RHMOL_Rhmol13G0145500 [Rhododendron molle]|uniref:Uncharacterized protein n=1 Tax=Rhododendron molle TaxID=49168 RepID=A0ACC0L7N7_RHOML|nr:hypothetical protein RHMOL_Rhmol13G0145500 [Rhododendron molle]